MVVTGLWLLPACGFYWSVVFTGLWFLPAYGCYRPMVVTYISGHSISPISKRQEAKE
jgi:hypothetical protein